MNLEWARFLSENFYVCSDCGALVALELVGRHQAQPHEQAD
jgi:hypothetical protein